jgi:hypothetical protein
LQTLGETNWWLEAAKIVVPIVLTALVGLWIARHSERFKRRMEKDVSQFQTRDTILHEKRVDVAEKLHALISHVEFEFSKCYREEISTEEYAKPYRVPVQPEAKSETAKRLVILGDELRDYILEKQIYIEPFIANMTLQLAAATKFAGLVAQREDDAFPVVPGAPFKDWYEVESFTSGITPMVQSYVKRSLRKLIDPNGKHDEPANTEDEELRDLLDEIERSRRG